MLLHAKTSNRQNYMTNSVAQVLLEHGWQQKKRTERWLRCKHANKERDEFFVVLTASD
ncbi:hypothetical protein [Armatimonas sp.]|uniref:hypothetical protein n=1 Tax=Armatimonas sp. TaxID=1872638 RepID=UPI00374D8879